MTPPLEPPPVNVAEYTALIDALELCFMPERGKNRSMNHAAVARILGIARPTYMRLRELRDDWGWWPVVFKAAIELAHTGDNISPHNKRESKDVLRTHGAFETMIYRMDQTDEARDYLYRTLINGPVKAKRIFQGRKDISVQRLRRAAHAMGVVISRTGKGKDHKSTWSLPEDE